MDRADNFAWYVLRAISLVSGMASGAVARRLSPARSRVVLAGLLLLAFTSVFFAQLPQPRSVAIIAVWAAATPIGIILGFRIGRRHLHVV